MTINAQENLYKSVAKRLEQLSQLEKYLYDNQSNSNLNQEEVKTRIAQLKNTRESILKTLKDRHKNVQGYLHHKRKL